MFKGQKVVTVHDFTHERFATGLQRFPHGLLKRVSIQTADALLCISESTREDLAHYYPCSVADKTVCVIPNAVSGKFYPDPKSGDGLQVPYMLWVGARDGYKNFAAALRCLHVMRQNGVEIGLHVVGSVFSHAEIDEISRVGLNDAVENYPNADRDQLRQLYSNALALLYLSKYEGFGLPILEAQRCHCPVICLAVPACKEVGGDSVLYLDEGNPESIINLLEILRHPRRRREITDSGENNTRRYSWDVSVEALAGVYKELALHQ